VWVSDRAFDHAVLFYGSDEEFLAGTVPLLQGGIEAGEPSLVAVRRSRSELLRRELGSAAEEVEFVDMEVVGRNPARIIPVWRDFLERAGPGTAVRGVGEPVWPGRDAAELGECQRHEQLLNLAFGRGREWSLLCPYDTAGLDDDVLAVAYESHAHAICEGNQIESPAWSGGPDSHAPFAGTLPAAPADATALKFDRGRLSAVRDAVGRESAAASLSSERRADLVVAVSELAANSVLHGGGRGTLRVWREPAALLVEILDRGTIEQPLVGRLRPGLEQEGGRGLWMVNQLCDLVQIRSGPDGSAVRLRMSLDWPSSGLGQGQALAETG
jgi:anti-sigma regulatory factor (Ser/Thr protein kinase)